MGQNTLDRSEVISGVAYLITNKLNGKKYIGITTMTTEARWMYHVQASRSSKRKTAIASAIRKYGADAFCIERIGEASTWAELCELERSLIVGHGSFMRDGNGYNMTLGGEGTPGHRHDEGTRHAIGAKLAGVKKTPEMIAKLAAANTGKRHSDETKALISAVKTGSKYPNRKRTVPVSDETRAKVSAALRGREVSPESRVKAWETRRANGTDKHSEDTKRRISELQRGRKLSDEQKAKVSAAHTGRKRSPETCARISEGKRAAQQARIDAGLPPTNPAGAEKRRGRKRTPEQCKNIREGRLRAKLARQPIVE